MKGRRERPRAQFFVITGMSGAGKSQAIHCLEDLGFFCIDNLPIGMLPKLAELCAQSGGRLRRIALGIDIREGTFLKELFIALGELEERGVDHRIVFLDADERTLLRRFSETRRRHPLGKRIEEGIQEERRLLQEIKAAADQVIDTSTLTIAELRDRLSNMLAVGRPHEMALTLVSFGYKYGLPLDADIIWDVRFLPNPNYVPRLKPKTGQSPMVQRYLTAQGLTRQFQRRFFALLRTLLPAYTREGKSYLTIAVGCTGGRHRSVAIVEWLGRFLEGQGYPVKTIHRDLSK